jgi:hypothetical protein
LTTLSIITACWGDQYAQFIPRWWQGLQSLNRKPDEIILGVIDGDPVGLAKSIPEGIKAKVVLLPDLPINYKWDETTKHVTSKWFSQIPIDDELLPSAYDEIDQADKLGAELYVDSIQYRHSGQIWKGHWDCSSIAHVMPAPQLIPTTLELYNRLGQKFDYRWSDWIYQIDAAKSGAKPFIASTVRMLFDSGLDRVTESGPNCDPAIRQAEDSKVYNYAKANGF